MFVAYYFFKLFNLHLFISNSKLFIILSFLYTSNNLSPQNFVL